MSKFCPECGNKLSDSPKFCPKCGKELKLSYGERKKIEPMQKSDEIKCPFCNNFFTPPKNWIGEIKAQRTTSTSGNIIRGAVFLPWGVVSAVKNKSFIKCPHCNMKIMQG